MEQWQWYSVKPSETKFFDFYRRVVRKYGNMTGEIKINWKINGRRYRFVFDQIDHDIFGVELYQSIKSDDGKNTTIRRS